MSRALLSFLGGMGTGYLAQQDKSYERGRQEKLDVQNQQLFDAKMEDINRTKADRQALVDVGRPATTVDGTAVDDGSGNQSLYKTPPNAEALDSMQAEADMRAEQTGAAQKPLSLAAARGLSAGVGASRIYIDPAKADEALAAYNTSEASDKRTVQALRATGRASEAMQMEAATKSGKMSDISLKAAQTKEVDDFYNATVMDSFKKDGVFLGAVAMMNKTNALGLGGMTFEATPSADGKMMEFYSTDKAGKRTLTSTVTNDKSGEMEVIAGALKLSPDKKIDWYQDAIKRAAEAKRYDETVKREDKRFEQTFGQTALQNQRTYDLQAQTAKQSGAAASVALDLAKLNLDEVSAQKRVPVVIRDQVAIIRDQLKSIDAAQYKSMSEGTYSSETPGVIALNAQRQVASDKLIKLLTPYMPVTQGIPVEQAKPPLPPGLTVGAASKQADGIYPPSEKTLGRQITIKNGKITEIK